MRAFLIRLLGGVVPEPQHEPDGDPDVSECVYDPRPDEVVPSMQVRNRWWDS